MKKIKIKPGIEYSNNVNDFYIRHHAPKRRYYDIRSEFNNDALLIKENCGPVYVGFSAGVDCQIITRCFIDMKVDAEYVFLHSVGYNDQELEHVKICEKFFGIKVRVFPLNLEEHKSAWLKKRKRENVPSMHQYPFEWFSKQLPEKYPLIVQGSNEPYLVGSTETNVGIYRNYFEDSQQRSRLMSKYRPIIDFPYTAESIASYYTDNNTKTFASTIRYYHENRLSKNNERIPFGQYWNYYAKPMVKGQHFKDSILWFGKLTGYENYPDWFESFLGIYETRVSIPYWDLVEYLEKNIGSETYKDYRDWHYGQLPGYKSINDPTL